MPEPSERDAEEPARSDELMQNRLHGLSGAVQRAGAIEGVAVVLIAAMVMLLLGLGTGTVWLAVVGGTLMLLTLVDVAILAALRRRRR